MRASAGTLFALCFGAMWLGEPALAQQDLSLESLGLSLESDRVPKPQTLTPISIDAEELIPVWNAAESRRVDVVAIGDSNMIHSGGGWDAGLSSALYGHFGMYGTGVVACGSINGNTASQGYLWGGQWFPQLFPQDDGAPLELLMYWGNFTAVVPSGYGYIAPGRSFNPQLLGITLAPTCPIDVNGPLRFHLGYGTFPITGGSFTPGSRYDDWPYSPLVDAAPVSTYSPAGFEMRVATLDLPAGSRQGLAVYGGFTRPFGAPIVGPMFATMTRCENLAKQTGIAFSSLVYDGGRSLRSMALRLQSMSDSQFDYYVQRLTQLQNGSPTALVIVNSGLNDRNETLSSVGPRQVQPGFSAEAFYDNLVAIKLRFEESWLRQGFDPSNLYFLVAVSHPIEAPDDRYLLQYRNAAEGFARDFPRAAAIRLDRLTNAIEMRANGWYYNPADTNHLSFSGFLSLGDRIFSHLLSFRTVSGDVDHDGVVGVSDIALVVSSWGLDVEPAALGDANHDGFVDLADLAIVIVSYGESVR